MVRMCVGGQSAGVDSYALMACIVSLAATVRVLCQAAIYGVVHDLLLGKRLPRQAVRFNEVAQPHPSIE
jgi:hypothetical protein